MQTKDLQEFLERGYLQIPYIIIRKFTTVYIQVPIHRLELKEHFSEGIFIHPAEEEIMGYREACHVAFEIFYENESDKAGPMDMCLVLERDRARFIGKNGSGFDEKGRYVYGSVPWGGMLYSCAGEVMRVNDQHYVI